VQTRYIGSAIAALAALSPSISNAWPGKASLDACVAAFEKAFLERAVDRSYKVVFSGDRFAGSVLPFAPVAYSYELAANDSKGTVLARARCSANERGAVTSLVVTKANHRD